MKKLFYLFSASLLVFTSCSSDGNSSDPATSTLVKKMVSILGSGSDSKTFINQVTYSGNKIVNNVGQDGFISTFTYTEDHITKIENSGRISEYTYENNKVKTCTRTNYYMLGVTTMKTLILRMDYSYNTDDTVSFIETTVDPRSNDEYINATGKFTFADGNLVKKEKIYESSKDDKFVTTYEYDKKSNPNKNILGYNLLLDYEIDMSANNVLNTTETSTTPNSTIIIETYSYTYNVNGFPTEKKYFASDGRLLYTMQYFY